MRRLILRMLTSIDGFIADHGDAFVAAIRQGDFEALIAMLDPDVVLRADSGTLPPPATQEVHGALAVAELATTFSHVARCSRPALVNRMAGLVTTNPGGEPYSAMGFTISDGRIVEIDILADPERLARLDVTVSDE